MELNRFLLLCLAITLGVIIILIFPIVSAATDTQQVDDVFKVNQRVQYAKPCFNNGTYCSASAVCNYTFYRPDNSIQVNNKIATNNIATYNYTITFDTIGIYTIDMVCTDGSEKGSETFYAQITPSGFNENLGFYVLILAILACITLLGFKLQDEWFVILGGLGCISLGLYSINSGIAGYKDMFLTWGTSIFLIASGSYLAIRSTLELLNE